MRRVLGTIGGLTLLISLSAYGARAMLVGAQEAQVPATGSARAAMTQAEFDRIIIERESRIVAQLGLSPQQRSQYDVVRAEQAEKTQIFRNRRPHRPEEGMELNAWWHNCIRQVFTPEQYNLYLRLWNRAGVGSVEGGSTVEVAAASTNSLEGEDDRILATLGLNARQKRQAAAHQEKMRVRRVERQEIRASGDRDALLKHDAETVRINQNMKNILTKDQYRRYRAAWDKAYAGAGIGSGSGTAFIPARAVL
jgi:hypothetical protein